MVLGHHHAACVCRTGQDSLGIGRSPGFGTNHHWLYLCGIPFFPGANGVTVIGSLCKQQVSSGHASRKWAPLPHVAAGIYQTHACCPCSSLPQTMYSPCCGPLRALQSHPPDPSQMPSNPTLPAATWKE